MIEGKFDSEKDSWLLSLEPGGLEFSFSLNSFLWDHGGFVLSICGAHGKFMLRMQARAATTVACEQVHANRHLPPWQEGYTTSKPEPEPEPEPDAA
jgi:hypothetical protein